MPETVNSLGIPQSALIFRCRRFRSVGALNLGLGQHTCQKENGGGVAHRRQLRYQRLFGMPRTLGATANPFLLPATLPENDGTVCRTPDDAPEGQWHGVATARRRRTMVFTITGMAKNANRLVTPHTMCHGLRLRRGARRFGRERSEPTAAMQTVSLSARAVKSYYAGLWGSRSSNCRPEYLSTC